MAFLVLAVAILFAIPSKSVRLLATRLVAFAVDFILLALLTVAVVGILFTSQLIEPSSIVSMAIIWSWILLFVFVDWRFSGTPGQLLLGLRLKRKDNTPVDLLGCLARNLLLFVVPLCLAGPVLTYAPDLGSRVNWSVAVALLAVFPLSVAISGGQSLPDLLLGIVVLPRLADTTHNRAELGGLRWLCLLIGSALAGIIFAFGTSVYGSLLFERKPPPAPITRYQSTEADTRLAAQLWPYLQMGIREPQRYLYNVRVITIEGELPDSNDNVVQIMPFEKAYAAKKTIKLVQAQISSRTSNLMRAALLQNFLAASSLRFPQKQRPAFVLFEFFRKEDFGVFEFRFWDTSILCLMFNKNEPVDFYVASDQSLGINGSINEPSILFLGYLDARQCFCHR
jgi:uncharacterized RDD family membrane protein YckC